MFTDFSEVSIRNGMKEWIESRNDRCYDTGLYNELPQEIKAELDNWIQSNIMPDENSKFPRSSYGLKTDFRRDTGIYIYSGVLDGALMAAGYKPVNTNDKNKFYSIKCGCCQRC
jgi:hypothetical protein